MVWHIASQGKGRGVKRGFAEFMCQIMLDICQGKHREDYLPVEYIYGFYDVLYTHLASYANNST